ncbi:hypothetical protein ATK30_7351 [Amycolatopsis echigonensis]|uniref:Uncharacterized protein n=1 Tax=Amycolatopsis echigonensis TaxID=2576905 RepID=A0A2N3WRD0_9PSEU|nr:hypothetical protein ATK30_7351 [Amycolatopsis niigatensis]
MPDLLCPGATVPGHNRRYAGSRRYRDSQPAQEEP